MSAPWYSRFLSSTRGRLLTFLRRDTRTVDEMAAALHLTDNAVRTHVAALERDGLVQQCGVRRSGGAGKPAYAYALTGEGEQLFPKPYANVLNELLDSLDEHVSSGELAGLLREVGQHIALRYPAGQGDVIARLEAAAGALNQLGGLAELEERDGKPAIQGYGCPLAVIVPGHPEVCQLAGAFVSTVAGIPVRECCNRSAMPRCRFELPQQ